MKKNLYYTNSGLDRVSHLRKDDPWISERIDHPTSQFIPVWREKNLIVGSPRETRDVKAAYLSSNQAMPLMKGNSNWIYLGEDEQETAWFAIDVSFLTKDEAAELVSGAHFDDLWTIGTLLPPEDGSRLAFAKGMAYWNKTHMYCGRCGAETKSSHAGHVRRCSRDECGKESFPRTDPAVIMLITAEVDGEEAILLGRQAVWPRGMYSVLAGFVEPGESLEEAVAREVFEEAGVRVEPKDVVYCGSQPWPFPASIMVGLRAPATDITLNVNKEEMDDARWFKRSEIEARKELKLYLPRPVSIARALIDDWLKD
ncbi:MAG: NAD(+) diphosphatase [Alphaproteobacteria bacterium]|nr:NAD(+) diphosphatase [Alphaproteobacteria bacterium]